MSIIKLKHDVLDPGLCTGCGACGLVCPRQVIVFDPDSVTPRLDFDTDGCADCGDCHAVCPGADPGTDAAELALYGRTRTADERWLGIFSASHGACSRFDDVVSSSSSGGAVTTLLLASQARLDVRHTLTMGRAPGEGWRAAPQVSGERAAIVGNAQSTYQLAPYLQALRACYEQTPDENVAVVGLACHMQALRKLQRLPTEIGRWAGARVVLMIETACSSNTLPAGTSSILRDKLGLDTREVALVKYRAGAYPGRFQATLTDNGARAVEFWEILGQLKQNKTHRCLSCGDWMSGLADVSVCDGDPNIFDASVNGTTESKHARMLVRTGAGDDLVGFARDQDMLACWPIALDGFNLGLERKKNRRRAYEGGDLPIPAGPSAGEQYDAAELCSDDALIDPQRYRK